MIAARFGIVALIPAMLNLTIAAGSGGIDGLDRAEVLFIKPKPAA